MHSSKAKNLGGRPSKFSEPSRPVTITLPERILSLLSTVNPDRALAITSVVDSLFSSSDNQQHLFEIRKVSTGKSIILVGHSKYLSQIPWLRLIEVGPARHIISIQSGTSIESMEVAIHDLLEDLPDSEHHEREILEALMKSIRTSRRSKKSVKEEILFVEMDE